MNIRIIKRTLEEANYILKTKETLRNTAKYFGISKSTVHKDMQKNLKKLSTPMYEKVLKILKYHNETKHINGGNKTKENYLKKEHQKWVEINWFFGLMMIN